MYTELTICGPIMSKYFFIFVLFALAGCHRHCEDLEPKICYAVQDKYLKNLKSAFTPLSPIDKHSDWGKEYAIGLSFAKELDLYQAITAFKRANILLSDEKKRLQVEYEILLCYYLGKKYEELLSFYEGSSLRIATSDFAAFHDLTIIIYDTYVQLGDDEKAQIMLEYINSLYPEDAKNLTLSTAYINADFCNLPKDFVNCFNKEKKSVGLAQGLNALIPGSGYLYLGQKQSALTAFLLNGTFIAAAYHFFDQGHLAAGIIFTSFEAGWYFGGIYGAAQEAKFYNERLYECQATPLMNRDGLFPVFMLKYAF